MITFEHVTVDGCMAGFFGSIAVARQGGIDSYPALRDALASLIGLEVARTRVGFDEARLAAFYREVATLLSTMTDDLQYFAEHLADDAEQATDCAEADWYDLCLRRSMVELVLTAAESPAAQTINPDDVERADRELRRLGGAQVEPLPARLVPPGLSSHWWWRLARAFPGGESCDQSGPR